MTAGSGDFDVRFGPEWDRTVRALREASREFSGDIEDALYDAGRLAAMEAEARLLAIPTTGRHHTGLRENIAADIEITHETARQIDHIYARAQVKVNTTDPNEIIMARAFDKRGGWNHPVYGRGSVHQRGRPWFKTTFRRYKVPVTIALARVVSETARRIQMRAR